jgi:multidrug resistance efflux pump
VEGAEVLVRGERLKLKEVEALDPTVEVNRAKEDVKAKEAKVEQARLGVLEHDVYAPADGTILRVLTCEGEILGGQPKAPAIQFCPRGERIIRAEVQQEWAAKVAEGQSAVVEDETRGGYQWKGKVTRVSDWFAHRRSMVQEPFQYNDVRTLECLISLEPGGRPLRIGQNVRVIIKQGGP